MIISLRNYMGSVIYSYLEKHKAPCLIRRPSAYNVGRFQLLTDGIKVLIPKWMMNKYMIGLTVPMDKAFLINNLFEEKISEDLHTFCVVYQKAGFSQRQAIEDFADMHNIELEIDITYAAFKKAEYRHKKELNKSPANLSPTFFDPKILF